MLMYGGFSNRERRRESCADPVSDPGQTLIGAPTLSYINDRGWENDRDSKYLAK